MQVCTEGIKCKDITMEHQHIFIPKWNIKKIYQKEIHEFDY